MEKIALIVPSYIENIESLKSIIETERIALHDDSYRHKPNLLRRLLLQEVIKIYAQISKSRKGSRGGSGKVEYIYYVNKIFWDENKMIPCPDKKIATRDKIGNYHGENPARCWNYVYKIEKMSSPKEWKDFIDVETNKPLPYPGVGRMLNRKSYWYYVLDEFE